MTRLPIGALAGAGSAAAVASLAMLMAGGEALPQTGGANRDASLAAWGHVAGVLQHPRCLNCHQPNQPMQGDPPRPHSPRVVRGRDNRGAPGMRCGSCHSELGNNEASRAPGAAEWKMPPRSMTWAGLSTGELCRTVKDPRKNGGRSPRAILKHMEEDSLVHWSWEPGSTRKSAPMLYEVFLEMVEEWISTGMHCPN